MQAPEKDRACRHEKEQPEKGRYIFFGYAARGLDDIHYLCPCDWNDEYVDATGEYEHDPEIHDGFPIAFRILPAFAEQIEQGIRCFGRI
mgnify:CR=1 FL=1